MKFIVKKILLITGFAFFVNSIQAQVKLNLSMLPDNQTYMVSLVSETTLEAPANITGSIQIVLKIPAQDFFEAGEIQSMVSDALWLDNVYLDAPEAAPDWSFVSFTLQAPFSKTINYEEGQETPLFTFKNVATDGPCGATVYLANNEEFVVKEVVASGFNVTQNLTVLGMRGNAYDGLLNAEVNCSQLTNLSKDQIGLIDYIRVSPVPSSEFVKISWKLADDRKNKITLLVMNELGMEVQRKFLDNLPGKNEVQLDVSKWPSGIFTFRFISGESVSKVYKMVVTH